MSRSHVLAVAVLAASAIAIAGCSPGTSRPMDRPDRPASASASNPASSPPADSSTPSGVVAPTAPVRASSRPPAHPAMAGARTTPDGNWWGVDSTGSIDAAALTNAQGWYRGGQRPAVWGRYISGHYALRAGELAFARAHGIYVYLLVSDRNCSVCAGGSDVCGNDRTAAQAIDDARDAIRAADRARIPAGAMLFKDIEEVGTCTGELTSSYLTTWFHTVLRSRYRAGFYANTYRQRNDFPRAYCQSIRRDPTFADDVLLADDEPEPAISAARHAIGPANAPRFAPDAPWCASPSVTRIWQYGESTTRGNDTDVDEVRPDTAGLLAPDGSVTR